MSPVETESQNEDNDENSADSKNVSHSVAVIHIDNSDFNVVFDIPSIKNLMTNPWWILEASADGVENGLSFQLASIGRVVDHDWWEEAGAILAPVFDILINESISGAEVIPLRFVLSAKTLIDAFLGFIPIKFLHDSMTIGFGAYLVDFGVAVHMHGVNIVPE